MLVTTLSQRWQTTRFAQNIKLTKILDFVVKLKYNSNKSSENELYFLNGIQEVSGSIPLISTKNSFEIKWFRNFSFAFMGNNVRRDCLTSCDLSQPRHNAHKFLHRKITLTPPEYREGHFLFHRIDCFTESGNVLVDIDISCCGVIGVAYDLLDIFGADFRL